MHFVLSDGMRADSAIHHAADEQHVGLHREKAITQRLGCGTILVGIIDMRVVERARPHAAFNLRAVGVPAPSGGLSACSFRLLASFLRTMSRLRRDGWSRNYIPSRWSIS